MGNGHRIKYFHSLSLAAHSSISLGLLPCAQRRLPPLPLFLPGVLPRPLLVFPSGTLLRTSSSSSGSSVTASSSMSLDWLGDPDAGCWLGEGGVLLPLLLLLLLLLSLLVAMVVMLPWSVAAPVDSNLLLLIAGSLKEELLGDSVSLVSWSAKVQTDSDASKAEASWIFNALYLCNGPKKKKKKKNGSIKWIMIKNEKLKIFSVLTCVT